MTVPQPDSAFHRLICSLNDEYGLGILQPLNFSLRGSGTRHHDEACDIYVRLRLLHERQHTPELLGRFRQDAQQVSRAWVPKPRGDPDLLPELSDPHSAQADQDRAALRRCLLDLLNNYTLRPNKRVSDGRLDQSPSRPASRPRVISQDHDYIDSIPVRSQVLARGKPDPYRVSSTGLHHQAKAGSFANSSANTSKVSLATSVFSSQESENTQSTSQDTEYTDSRSGKRAASQAQVLDDDDDDATSEINFLVWDQPTIDDNCTIRGAPSEYSAVPALANHRAVPRRWSGSTGAFSDGLTSEDYELAFNQMPRSADEHLRGIWPHFPSPFLVEAPLAVLWEVTRIALQCGVNLKYFDLTYEPSDPAWHDQAQLRAKLSAHRLFQNKMLPEKCDNAAWNAALHGFRNRDKVVVLAAELAYNVAENEPLFKLSLKPLRLQLGHRLDRRFGPDRFLEITIPSPTHPGQQPKRVKSWADGSEGIIRWLCNEVHALLGRQWKPFFTKPVKTVKRTSQFKDPKEKDTTLFQEQIFFFATDGHQFRSPIKAGTLPTQEEANTLERRTKLQLADFLEWTINVSGSGSQPAMKLFSRISLSLTRTYATVVLDPSSILHRDEDLLSTPKRNQKPAIMNDGMGRMSYGFAKQVAQRLDLDYTPSVFQGRLGSAKGMWIRDVQDDESAGDIWIETYPSQRKFDCPFIDVQHRTFEVKGFTKTLKPASLNRQFIPILEAQAKAPQEKVVMRQRLETHLANTIRNEVATHLSALEHPAETLMFARQINTSNATTLTDEGVPFLGGAPKNDADLASFLISSGFQAQKNTLLDSTLWRMWESRIKSVKEKWNAEVPCSTHVYMGVDFTGVLQPGEVHLSFSSDFTVDGFSDTQLEGMDVLVARAPAHFPSDIQRVRAVSKPQLRKLKDVILFPRTGNRALADLLSGGDYDGDRAWVCWDPDIVKNFSNSTPGEPRDFIQMGYLRKRRETFIDIRNSYEDLTDACDTFALSGMSFSMQPSLLGICTKFKEKMCYYKGVDCEGALILCDLVGNLVDQAKGGIEFNDDDWGRLCQRLLSVPKFAFEQPEYEKDMSSAWRKRKPPHILDYLKFKVANELIQECSTKLHAALCTTKKGHTDADLTAMYRFYFDLSKRSPSIDRMLKALEQALLVLRKEWNMLAQANAMENWEARVTHLHGRWVNIEPPEDLKVAAKIRDLNDPWSTDGRWSAPFSRWSLLKASTTFFNHYTSPSFAFRMAGRQLALMKSMALDNSMDDAASSSAVLVRPMLWAVQKPDRRVVERLLRRRSEGWNEKVAALDDVTDYADDGTVLDD